MTGTQAISRIDLASEARLSETTQWRSYHVFYGGSPYVLLQECLLPLANRLVAEGTAVEYFFINYWLEGAHVRLRFRVNPDKRASLDRQVMAEAQRYLDEHPSLHPMKELLDSSLYTTLFDGEFTDAARPHYFADDGTPVFAENNTVQVRDYVPEWDRYGGEKGMLLSERCFVDSSKQVDELMSLGNLRVRGILLGMSAQLTFITAACLLKEAPLIVDFFRVYHRRWLRTGLPPEYATEKGRKEIAPFAAQLGAMITEYAEALKKSDIDALPHTLQNWARVCTSYINTVEHLYESNESLEFDFNEGHRAAANPTEAAWALCHSFIHMTNNRMLVSVADEAFVAYLILMAMGDDALVTAGEGGNDE